MLQTYVDDECCEIGKAIESGELEGKTVWECPHCGMEWCAMVYGDVKHWSPFPAVAIV